MVDEGTELDEDDCMDWSLTWSLACSLAWSLAWPSTLLVLLFVVTRWDILVDCPTPKVVCNALSIVLQACHNPTRSCTERFGIEYRSIEIHRMRLRVVVAVWLGGFS